MSIVINTPGGNIGRALTEKLLAAGEQVVIISRNPSKVSDLVERGARIVEGSIDDEGVLEKALKGAESLFWLTPPVARPDYDDWSRSVARSAAKVAKANGVGRVVIVSSLGAHTGPGTGPVSVMRDIENGFKELIPNVASLRAGFFMENLLLSVSSIAQTGSIFMPAPADKTFPFVATRDIANTAASYLLARGWTGHVTIGVHGPKDLSYAQAAEVLSKALGKKVNYVQVSVEQAKQSMLGMGMPGFLATIFAEMYQAIVDGRMDPAEPRTPESTTPTTLFEFAREVLAPAVQAASKGA